MISEDRIYDRLAALYGADMAIVEQGGKIHPAATQAWTQGEGVGSVLRMGAGAVPIDAELAAAGAAHLEAVRATSKNIHNGTVVAFQTVTEGALNCVPATYFEMLATSDVLRVELLEAPAGGKLPLRQIAHDAAQGTPLSIGAGRAAAVGVTVLVSIEREPNESVFVLGRRRGDLAADPGYWHIAPSGMVEPGGNAPLVDTVRKELREELGLTLPNPKRLQVLGLGWDLLRLRPDICLRLHLSKDQVPAAGLSANGLEFQDLELVPVGALDSPGFWRSHHPMTPAASAALTLFANRRS